MWKRAKAGRWGSDDATALNSAGLPSPSPDDRRGSCPEPAGSSGSAPLARHPSAISDINAQLHSPHQRQRSQDRRNDPLGLIVLHTPPERTVDILFIHGLGGTSLRTWCRDRDLDNLWPQLWLPDELPTARILTFGYNAHFSSKKEQASFTIGDFAADLLFRMRYGESTPERLGQVPIIVVAHSMGGLVFKKAFVQGHLNNEFADIISMIKAVLFLATPHRGTNLAETLNRFLSSSIFGHTPKDYITELARRSPTIDELNEAFRHHASTLRIFSFYETLTTSIGRMSVMILDKSTAVMGYPRETPTPLTANHHDVCKFTSTNDPNYLAVVGALRSVVDSTASKLDQGTNLEDDLRVISDFLGVSGPPDEDLAQSATVRKQGTCHSFIQSEELTAWLDTKAKRILWAHAPPGTGKSTLSSFLIEHLLDAGRHCAYFFFKYGQRRKRLPSDMLRSIAYQMALRVPEFRQTLLELARSGVKLSGADSTTVWKKVFLGTLPTPNSTGTLYWVIDGVDESDSSKQVVEFISGTANLGLDVRVLVLSRPLPSIHRAFQLAKRKSDVVEMPLPDNSHDIRSMVAEEIDYLISGDDFKERAVHEIASRSQGNFLWASLVTRQIVKCHRQEQVERILSSTPDGMEQLFDRMIDTVVDLEADEDKDLAKILLTWAIYATAPVTVEELSEVYPTKLKSILDLNHTVSQVCGQFVVVNTHGSVALVHHSAREYLKKTNRCPFSLDPERAHEELFGKCLVTLCNKNLRRNISSLKVPLFLPYASTSWAAHLEGCSVESDRVLDALVRFFSSPSPLAWIQYLAMGGRLAELLAASAKLTTYVRERKKTDADKSPLLHRLSDLLTLETWAVDLMKLTAKFGRHLCQDPTLIYKCIPALSPASSVIHQKFNENPASALSVSGLSKEDWDDCLARVSGSTGRALRLACSPLHLAVASDTPRGSVTVWDTKLFDELKCFNLGEHVWELAFSHSGSLLGCYTVSKTFVWKTTDWSLRVSANNPRRERAITMAWDDRECLMMVTEQRRVYRLSGSEWEQLSPELLEEPDVPEGTFLSTPSSVAFNSDCTQIAVAYRSFPMSIWNVDPPEMVARLRRRSRQGQGAANSYTGDNHVVWHPKGAEILGINGPIFKWNPTDDTYDDVKGDIGIIPHGIICSPDGHVFLTMDVGGSVKIYDYSSMSLIYKLSSEDRINQIHFSPDNLRFYDLRGSYCNVWEPNCLLRLAEAASETVNDTGSVSDDSFWSDAEDAVSTSLSFPPSESHADSRPAVMSVEPGKRYYDLIAHANEDGSLTVYDPSRQKKHEIARTMFNMAISSLVWSPKHDRLAYALASGATTVKSICSGGGARRSEVAETIYAEKRTPNHRGRTTQLLFDSTGNRLFICGLKKWQVLSIPEGTVLAERPQSNSESEAAYWQQHPVLAEYLLCFKSDQVAVFSWNDLCQQVTITIESPTGSEAKGVGNMNETEVSRGEQAASLDAEIANVTRNLTVRDQPVTILDGILDSHSPNLLLLRTKTLQHNRELQGFRILQTASVYARVANPGAKPASPTTTEYTTPPSLAAAVAVAIGILPDNRLVFLDKRLWVCTAALPLSSNPSCAQLDIVRHFFIPHDWVTAHGLRLCRLLRDGTFLCPSKGEVAVMRWNLVRDW
ncbi:hypothetical protein QBC34DRAFT_317179 [Podospora aff. communis PSN243]|uniref:GPI inositol-deacylase n=1 Tax=Podospora aff. communis PSN243 TaxID=3040156 RepID=A0AAV9H066_9PEZI|nr:hypothetical protein QBC34DRAFT_317179 [Podospora aff. communis PSN243]